MRCLLCFSFLLINFSFAFSQANQSALTTQQSAMSGNAYAVVIGISQYSSKGIKSLKYADKDAEVFAHYLQSKAGGSLPEEHIRLLTDSNATCAAIYDALSWLLDSCQKNDLVYFYFAGHGDMENNTIYKLGFLLSYNTPRNNYINNAIRIEDLNYIANTLSVKKQANVVLITDACHSGKLAGSDYRGTFLVGDQLRAVKNKEIRITACAPDQLSSEDEGWGGGRGVFSYYLVNGLTGLADKQQDGTVTLNEVKNYIDSSFSADLIIKQNKIKQNPVLEGTDNFKLAKVDTAELSSLKRKLATSDQLLSNTKLLPEQPHDYFFKLLKQENAEAMINFGELNKLSKEEIAVGLVSQFLNSQDSLVIPEKLYQLKDRLSQSPDAVKRFNKKLVEVLHNKGQDIINLYLSGDAAEMERRRYYNLKNNGYDIYPKMFELALKLTDPEDFLYRILEVDLHYFKGVNARLKIPAVEDPAPLVAEAMKEQQKALKLEENAAYIHNELGNLYFVKRDYVVAKEHFLRATEIAPEWAIPWANLVLLYGAMKDYNNGIAAFEKAKALQPDFQGMYVNAGMVYEKKADLLQAEELYRKAIKMNSRHYLPFERLGYVYMATTKYALADSFFYEADLRKRGYHFERNAENPVWWVSPATGNLDAPCNFDSADLRKDDPIGHFVWALTAYYANKLPLAEKRFKYVISLDKSNPLAFHYLGKLLYEQKRWEEADIIFNLAVEYYLDTITFNRYCDSMSNRMQFTRSKECFLKQFKEAYYLREDDHYFLASLYEKWNHFAEAESEYRKIIDTNPHYLGGYLKLWTMLESIGRYEDAKDVIVNYSFYQVWDGNNELNAFYKRMIARFPGNGDYYYKGGKFLYYLAAANPEDYPYDYKEILPDETNEKYISPNEITKAAARVSHSIQLPGTKEQIVGASHIFIPRSDGISWLLKADSLLANDEDALADIGQKLGDLYVWIGLTEKANKHYQRSVDLQPYNAGTRLKLADTYAETYYLHDAFTQLDSLYNRQEINFPKHVMLGRYYIHSGQFARGEKLLKEAEQIHPYRIPEIIDLQGRKELMSGHPEKALPFYKDYLSLNKNDLMAMYTIAKLYALKGNQKEAWNWLQNAMKAGFRYSYVLESDNAWNQYRKPAKKWNALMKQYPAKEYVKH